MPYLFLAAAAVLVLARPALGVYRFATLPPAAKRNWLPARWARLRWRWLAHNLGLAYIDRHRRALRRPRFGTSVKVRPADPMAPGRLRFPRARFRPDEYGILATVRTVPGVDRAAFDKQTVHIANAWKCHRAQVHQVQPGRLLIRGLRTDPLTLPYPAEDAPPGVYGLVNPSGKSLPPGGQFLPPRFTVRLSHSPVTSSPPGGQLVTPECDTLRLYLGRDEWAAHRWFGLKGTAGITVGGLPDYGKTTLVLSWLCQLAALGAVQFVFIDGKGGGDYSAWADRAWLFTGDELPAAVAALEDVHALMRSRLAGAARPGQPVNRWRLGPSPDYPLIVTVIDECHTFFDLDGVKGTPVADKQVRACRLLTGQLVRKGRSVLFVTILITQKTTSDAIPTAIRDNCRLGVSFAVKTREAAVAALGEHIREYPSYCPTTLLSPAYVGVATAGLPTAHDPFVRFRCPEVTEEAAAARAAVTAPLRRDPRTPMPAYPPAAGDVPAPVLASP